MKTFHVLQSAMCWTLECETCLGLRWQRHCDWQPLSDANPLDRSDSCTPIFHPYSTLERNGDPRPPPGHPGNLSQTRLHGQVKMPRERAARRMKGMTGAEEHTVVQRNADVPRARAMSSVKVAYISFRVRPLRSQLGRTIGCGAGRAIPRCVSPANLHSGSDRTT
ncbi:hypothetical protein CALVIDRAFT_265188 [Calocera viscosa TUFC12733]|uniref:Uncharacterized protein n=1 Tax=Calocera viscosa (strain TUFC12733) TaxID=1330018 RepID=A0A167J5H9_CALVF|nr:hypothetical protein CALVIDRAFT_265188 [Calocera viscosa TUFC12733]